MNGSETDVFIQNKSNILMNSSVEELLPTVKHPLHVVVIFAIFYSVIFLFALFGNIVVVVVVWKHRWMHTVTNFFIVNLAVADVLVAIFCIPITFLTNIYTEWRYGAVMCKLTPYLQGVSVCASVNTLAAIAVDRYLAICYTLNYKMTSKVSKLVVVCIWTFASVIWIPSAVFHQQILYNLTETESIYLCIQTWPTTDIQKVDFLSRIFLFCYTIPLLLIVGCYSLIGIRVWNRDAPGIVRANGIIHKSKVKVVKMLAVMVILFAFSWLPLYVLNLIILFDHPDEYATSIINNYIIPVVQLLGMSNSGINPIIYYLFSQKIRLRIKAMLTCDDSPEFRRHMSRFSSTRYVSVDYSNGQVTLRTYGMDKEQYNNTGKDEYYELLKQPVFMIVIYSFVYSAVFLCALLGNVMVVSVVIRNKSMQNVTNYFIVNLAVADILVSCNLPFNHDEIYIKGMQADNSMYMDFLSKHHDTMGNILYTRRLQYAPTDFTSLLSKMAECGS
ncbi:hypothetical protein KUTeg_003773 [Tegillarca granosa]|uniref:G-protein coupled receptors family 1 profile domain-containing protein n=1 Tax=Tegillarca granosa TaxID=220873 RepID=A0ABQ9FN34_TEGGR|nr:hypothetical protein KUTeg_003773 [Tegillarca granosa]